MPSPRKTQRPSYDQSIKDELNDRTDEPHSPRPAKRRKHVEDAPAEIPEEDTSSILADNSAISPADDSQLVAKVTEHLHCADIAVRASQVHANSIHEENNEGVQAYAKIAGRDWTFYVTKLTVNIGRAPEPAPKLPPNYNPDTDPEFLHIDLGPAKMVSRQHAQITFNAATERWNLVVKGRNGVKVNQVAWRLGQSKPLESGDVIEVGTIEMMFVLPLESHSIHIDDEYLQRAGILKKEGDSMRALRATTPLGADSSPHGGRNTLPRGQPTPIAPAPPDYRRPGTPPSARSRASVPGSQLRSPSSYRDSPMMAQHDVDLSLDENRNLKPQYSYAQMITQAIMQTPDEKLNLAGIYNYITQNYSYYRHQQASGWQNSIRHNLSLNKAFEKLARSTEEPGKGMKWYIAPEYKEELIRVAYRGGRGGHRGSSNPSSPNQLSYVNQGPRDLAARDAGSARKRRVSPSGSPQPRSSLRDLHMTPDRSSRRLLPVEAPASSDGSPLPRHRRGTAASRTNTTSTPKVGASAANDASVSGTTDEPTPRSPTLTSTFLQDDINSSFVTPAPHRVELKLNPPSTLQRPSQHMPTSSPAPFWRYADIGSTPLKPAAYDYSPSKALGLSSGPSTVVMPASSSPPPVKRSGSKSPISSPTRPSRKLDDETPKQERTTGLLSSAATPSAPTISTPGPAPAPPAESQPPPAEEEEEDDAGFDLTKGFQSIGSYHAPVQHGLPVPNAMNGSR